MQRGQITRADLARLSGLSPTTILEATSKFEALKLIDVSQSESSGGRRPLRIKLRDDMAYALGIDLGTGFARAVITDMNGNILCSHSARRIPVSPSRLEVPDVEDMAAKVLAKAGKKREDIAAIGIGITAFIDEVEKKCLFVDKVPEWTDFPIVSHYSRIFMNPHVSVRDSVKAMAFAERQLGCCRDVQNFVYITIGMGMGSTIYIEGKPLATRKGISGEIGHIDISHDGSICCCGNRGCLEASASGWAIIKRCRDALDTGVVSSLNSLTNFKDLTVREIIDAAHAGDKLSSSLIRDSAMEIAVGISILINILNPDKIVLSGGLVRGAGALFLNPLRAEVNAHVLPWLQKDIDFAVSSIGEYDSALGAALTSLDEFFFDILEKNETLPR